MGRSGHTDSVARALMIIEAVSDLGIATTAGEIAEYLQLPPASAYRLLNSLVAEEYLVRTTDLRGFALGNRLSTMVSAATTPFMSAQAREVCEKFRSSVRFGVHVIHFRPATLRVVDADPDHPLPAERDLIRSPHASAAGKCLLAAQSRWEELLPMPPAQVTANTTTGIRALAAQIKDIRAHGYAVEVDELAVGQAAVAVPIHDVDGTVRGAVMIAGITGRLDALLALIPAGRELAAALGPLLY